MKFFASMGRRRWLRRLLIGTGGALALITVVGFFVVPPVARHLAEKQLGELLGRRVSVARVRFNPFALVLAVEGFQVFEPDGTTPFVAFDRLLVNVEWASVYRRAPVVKEVSLETLRVHVARLQATPHAWADTSSYNFSDILARLTGGPKSPPPEPNAAPARFSVNNIRIVDAAITFDDRPLHSQHAITGLHLGIPFVSTLPVFIDTYVEPGLRLAIDGTPLAFAGRTKPFKDSQETTVELRADRFDLTRYLPYVPVPLRFDVASALLDLALDVSFVRSRADAPSLTVKGRVALEKLALREKSSAPLASLDQLEILIGHADVTGQSFAIDKVALHGLTVHVRRGARGLLNLELLAPAPPPEKAAHAAARPAPNAPPPPSTIAASTPPRFTVAAVDVDGVIIHLRDETVHPPMELTVDQLTVAVRGLSNAPRARATVTASLRAAPGGRIKDEGTLTLEPLAANGTLTWEGIEPGRFAPYYHDQIAFDLAGGQVRLGTGYNFRAQAAGPELRLSNAFVEIAALSLRERGPKGATRLQDEFFRLHDLAVRDVDADLTKHTVTVGQIVSHDGRVRAARNAAGVVDLTTLLPAAPPAPPTSKQPPPARSAAPTPPAARWTIQLNRLALDGWSVRFDDHQVNPAAVTTLSPIKITVGNFSTAPGSRANLDVRLGLNKEGRVAITGSAGLDPVVANLKLDLRTIEILPLQPYFADQVNVTVTDGTVSVKADAKVELPAAPERGPAPDPRIAFAGDVDVANFAAIDGAKHEPFLSWRSFHIGSIDVTTVPMKIGVREIALTDFYSRLMIYPDAHFNLQDIMATPKGAAPSPAKPAPPTSTATAAAKNAASAPPPPVTIGQVSLQGGHVSFTDHLIRPNYSAELTELGGRFSGLSSDPNTRADVDLRGAVDHSGALSIAGTMNPLSQDLFVNVKVALKDFELPPASPYAAKYAGYGISKGKLGLSLDYHIADKKLDARNHITVDQFTFGDKVKSPDATSLPVKLALAILKDRHGVIDLDVPIAGSLDDPDFKIGRAVLKVLGNLIVKAVTAPFSLIASAFGGGDQLSKLEFASGAATVNPGAQAKVRTLAKALQERPGLSFEIEGGADPARDREELRRRLFDQKLRAQQVLEAAQAGDPTPPAADAPLTATQRPHLLQLAYKAETFPKPRNFLGLEKDLPPAEMEKLIATHIVVDDDALRALAQQRANAVLASLAKIAPEGATRLFLVTPRLGSSPGAAVELRLKKD
ncbi:MAG TPA: DUF748 domain-containing protein [Polyangia bacterium]|nr:DUF748 domain-containing protein [Polyangia bacterium]